MSKPRYLYHWTHRRNLHSIIRKGLQTRYTTGALAAVWFCERKRLAWAMSHVCHNHGWTPDDLVCIRISTRQMRVTCTAMQQVYTIRHDVPPANIDAVLREIGSQWEAI